MYIFFRERYLVLSLISGICIKCNGGQNGAQTWRPNTAPRKTRHKRRPIRPAMWGSTVLIYIYSQKGLEKIAIFRGSKVIPKMKKGQKKCPFSENRKES